MSTRTCLCIVVVAGLLTAGVRGQPADKPAADSPGKRAGRKAGERGEQRERRSDATVRESGALQSADTLEIRNEVEGLTRVLHIVPEGSTVKKGDLLVELDASRPRDKQAEQKAALAEARGGLLRTETAVAGLREVGTSRLAVAELALKVAELDRQRFQAEGGELALEMKKIDSQIALAEKRLKVAEMILGQVAKAVEEGRAEKKNLEEASLAVFESKVQLEIAQDAKQLLTEHTRDYRNAVLELAIVQAKSTLVEIKTESRVGLQKAEAELHARRAVVKLEEKKLAQIEEQIHKCRIVAPRDGMVVYAGFFGSPVLKEGAVVRQRQPIVRMPDMSRLEVHVNLPESRIDRVRKGQPATIRFDAFPDREYEGKVTQVSDAPESRRRGDRSVKKYAVVSIEKPAPELRPGMTAVVEIDVSQSDQK
jgi:HlyD family secretion protein